MGADEIGIVNPTVIDVFTGRPLRLKLFDDITFLNQVMGDLDSGNLFERLSQYFRLIFVGRDGL